MRAIIDAPFSHNIACGLREILVGENPLETDRLWQTMYRRTMYFGRTSVAIAAMAAVDLALWDIKGLNGASMIARTTSGDASASPMPSSPESVRTRTRQAS